MKRTRVLGILLVAVGLGVALSVSVPAPVKAYSSCTTARLQVTYVYKSGGSVNLRFVASGCWWSEQYVAGTYGTSFQFVGTGGGIAAKISGSTSFYGSYPTTFAADLYNPYGDGWHPRLMLNYGGTWNCRSAGSTSGWSMSGCGFY
jgi:hypothetical protein